jgi:hypothetical protein
VTVPAPSDPLEAGLALAAAFEHAGVPYALGGALAYGLWGVPRATADVDVNVFVPDDGLAPVVAALHSLGIDADSESVRRAAENTGMFTVRWGDYRIDLFTPSIPFSWEACRTRVACEVDGRTAWFLSAEAIAVFKLLFFRGKDIVDLQRLVAVQGARLDVAYVRRQIVEMMGDDDERVRRWDELVALHGT